jgi:hypothetical protein
MPTMYRVSDSGISPVEVIGETEKFVTLMNNRREAKESTYYSYHNTWKEAHDKMLADAAGKLRAVEKQLERARTKLTEIKKMVSA